MESQMGKQDQVNQDLQRQMRTLVESFRKLEQKLAAQQAKLDAFGGDGQTNQRRRTQRARPQPT
jgi:hypothetical protein